MTIRRRIFFTNTVLICVGVFSLVFVNAIVIRFFSDELTNQEMQGETGIVREAELEELLEELDLDEINDQLSDTGYHVIVANDSDKEGKETFQNLRVTNAIASCIMTVILFIFATYLTSRLSKHILEPLNSLSQAARRIQNNDLTEPIQYKRNDEFAIVCESFDQMQAHLLKEQEISTNYERSRTNMIAGISHDLRTPLTSIKGYLKGVIDGVANTPEKQQQYISVSYRKTLDMETLLQKLFYLSTMETGNCPMYFQKSDFVAFVKRFVEYRKEENEEDIKFILECPAHPCDVNFDKEQMNRVLENLMENAVKYGRIEGQVLVIKIDIREENGYTILEFTDNGPGISEKELPFIFERFWRSDAARESSSVKGNGLGLSIIKHIVKMHNGRVYATSLEGLTVGITIPTSVKKG